MEFDVIIGLEIHIQLKTKSKMFCSCDNDSEGKAPNTYVCPVCLGHPGTLPVLNKHAVEWGILTARALNCDIPEFSKFDRKHYFYPDLPKAYQISQYDEPVGKNGFLMVLNHETGEEEKIRINRLHLEEDAAKNLHSKTSTLVDYNRGGTPLMEIVTEPDLKNPAQVKAFLQELQQLVRFLGVSDADMEKGHLRCDVNISLRPKGDNKFYAKTEIKNVNSFRSAERAAEYEVQRQSKLWLEGSPVKETTTRGWNDDKGITEEQRSKEEANDYRYFPEPDIPPLHFTTGENKQCDPSVISIDVTCIEKQLPELPYDKRKRFMYEFDIDLDTARQLTQSKESAGFTEAVVSELENWVRELDVSDTPLPGSWEHNKPKLVKLASNWIINNFLPTLEEVDVSLAKTSVHAENFSELILLLFNGKLNSTAGQQVLEKMIATGGDPSEIMRSENLEQLSDTGELETIIDEVIAQNSKPAEDFRNGKDKALQALVGQVMAKTKGKANPQMVTELFKKKLR